MAAAGAVGRAWPVAAAFSLGTLGAAVFMNLQFEFFGLSTLLGFGGLAVGWRARELK